MRQRRGGQPASALASPLMAAPAAFAYIAGHGWRISERSSSPRPSLPEDARARQRLRRDRRPRRGRRAGDACAGAGARRPASRGGLRPAGGDPRRRRRRRRRRLLERRRLRGRRLRQRHPLRGAAADGRDRRRGARPPDRARPAAGRGGGRRAGAGQHGAAGADLGPGAAGAGDGPGRAAARRLARGGRHGQPALRLRGRRTPRRSTSRESARGSSTTRCSRSGPTSSSCR